MIPPYRPPATTSTSTTTKPKTTNQGSGGVSKKFLEINGVAPQPAQTPGPAATTGPSATPVSTRPTAPPSVGGSHNKFLEINDALPGTTPASGSTPLTSTTAQAPPPAPAVNGSNTHFLEINGAYPQPAPDPFAGNPSLSQQKFLEINGVYPVQATPPRAEPDPNTVEGAATQLQQAIDVRDAQHPSVQRYYQPQVDLALANLDTAVKEEIEQSAPPHHPVHGQPQTLEQKAEVGQQIVARFADNPQLLATVQRSVDNVLVNYEVEYVLDYVNTARSPELAFDRLATRYDDLSPAAQTRIRADETVQQVFDDVATNIVEPLENLPDDFTVIGRVSTTVDNLQEVLEATENPDLAAEIVIRTQPGIDQAIETDRTRSNKFGLDDGMVDLPTLQKLGLIADRLVGAQNESNAVAGLARLAVETTSIPRGEHGGVPDTSEGHGVTLAVAIVKQLENDPSQYAQDRALYATNEIIQDYGRYMKGPVQSAINDYTEHTEELNYYIASFPPGLPPEKLQAAVTEYLNGRSDAWHEKLAELEATVAGHGANLLLQREQIATITHVAGNGDQKLADEASNDAFFIAVSVASDSHPEQLADIDFEAALEFTDTLKLGKNTLKLGRKLADSYVQSVVAPAIAGLDPTDINSLSAARVAIDRLRNPGFAESWGLTTTAEIAEFNQALDALEATLPKGRTTLSLTEISDTFDEFEFEIKDFKAFARDQQLGIAFRSMALAVSAQGAVGSTAALIRDPSLEGAVRAFVADAAFLREATELGVGLGKISDESVLATRFGTNANVVKVLGVAGLALSSVGVARNVQQGDYLQGAVGALGIGGSAYALFGAGAWAGPAGTAIALAATGVSIGIDQYRNVAKSNEYTGETARQFLAHAGFEPHAAQALADRAGEGYNAAPALIKYGELHGLSPEETIDWINSLDKSELDFVRDRFHYMLDDTNGSIDEFAATHEDDVATIRLYEQLPTRVHTPTSAATADWVLEQQGIRLPGE